MWAHGSIAKWVSHLCNAGKCSVILGINCQCFFMKNSHDFLKGKTEGILLSCSSWVTELSLKKKNALRTNTPKIIRRTWNDIERTILTLRCKLKKKKNSGVKVSPQYYALNVSCLRNYFLSFCPFFLFPFARGWMSVFFTVIWINTVYLEWRFFIFCLIRLKWIDLGPFKFLHSSCFFLAVWTWHITKINPYTFFDELS